MTTSRKETERQATQQDTLYALGFTRDEADNLRRISITLRRWFELECGNDFGCIARDDETGKPYWYSVDHNKPREIMFDRETGAKRRLAQIIERCNKARLTHETNGKMTPKEGLRVYIQGDCRGAALYIIRPEDIPQGEYVEDSYNHGLAIY